MMLELRYSALYRAIQDSLRTLRVVIEVRDVCSDSETPDSSPQKGNSVAAPLRKLLRLCDVSS
jgi:hypothetical protein